MDIASDVKERIRTAVKVKFSPDWDVIVYNDNTTPVDMVIDCLEDVFNMDDDTAYAVVEKIQASDEQCMVVATYPEKLAKIRAKKAMTYVHEEGYKDFKVEAKMREE